MEEWESDGSDKLEDFWCLNLFFQFPMNLHDEGIKMFTRQIPTRLYIYFTENYKSTGARGNICQRGPDLGPRQYNVFNIPSLRGPKECNS
ncbi:hypothetical protein NEOLEDRAFT_1127137 [Neolentinus lepideus HHB14362 ss-1]|uniref:Uncharacterized protein n=1 Tax=Neolentinus lepideus HHB14362 ss-1 TaxID=1314782 RepID=A0A165VUJ3_9AGAM|nr:hypothetical protein NEOLEDRAFT_1127137 [Neolentinus lepideus HHB14362 ss-1]